MAIKCFVEDSERFIEQICHAAQSDMHLLKGLLPSPFLLKGLKTAVMFLHNRLLRIQHETIDSCHRCLPFV